MKYWHYVAIAYTPQHVQCGELASVFETPNRTHAEMAFHQAAEQVAIQLTRIDGIPEKAYFSIRAFSLIEQDDLEPPAQSPEAPEISAELSGLLSSMPYHYEPVMDSVAIRESHIRRSLSRAMSQANSDRIDSDITLLRHRQSLMEDIVNKARADVLHAEIVGGPNASMKCKGCGYSMDLQQLREVDGECPQCGRDESMGEP